MNKSISLKNRSIIRVLFGLWALINGLLSIILSLTHIQLLGRFKEIYFANDTAWLAQHGVIVGVVMIYLSRHLMRGESRARQIILAIIGIEAFKYVLVAPNIVLFLAYFISFGALLSAGKYFQRGTVRATLKLRLKDVYYMVAALLVAAILALILLDRDSFVSRIANITFSNFYYYAFSSEFAKRAILPSILLANITTVFLAAGAGAILWILFRPYPASNAHPDNNDVQNVLIKYSNSSEDYFKFWPKDKMYFWNKNRTAFVAYKIVGSVAFALADPIGPKTQRKLLLSDFTEWCQARRYRVCFMPIFPASLNMYGQLTTVKIGASALVDSDKFINVTSKDKWWRWKKNKAIKKGFTYQVNRPPHSEAFMSRLQNISDTWLATDGHEERSFALGYFNQEYLQKCIIHTLVDEHQKEVAFANELPLFNKNKTATIDLFRYSEEANDSMPFLLANIIETTNNDGYKYFDLGFVPFAETNGPLLKIARTLRANQFSFKGLEQFKNKFDPIWQANYLAHDGDIADFVNIALNLEKAMELEKDPLV